MFPLVSRKFLAMRNIALYSVNIKTIKTIAQIFVGFSDKLNFKQYKYCMNPRPRLKGWNMQMCKYMSIEFKWKNFPTQSRI